MRLRDRLDQKWYPNYQDSWDGIAFREQILEHLKPEHTLLDIGAGREAVLKNEQIDQAVHNTDGSLKGVPDNSVDIVVSKHVLEHVATPETFFSEVSRVLRPGGIFLGLTPNKTHYMPLIASLTPLSFHKWFNKKRGRETFDTFPTTYLCNSRKDLTKWAEKTGMTLTDLRFEEGRPEYLRFSVPTYFFGYLYERLVNGLKLERLKCVLYITLTKNH